jgi:Ras GTPase-activating-like protein IQGAP2/3
MSAEELSPTNTGAPVVGSRRSNGAASNANRQSKRYSVAALYMSMGGVDRDDDIDDELAKAQKHLRELKTNISEQSKKNFMLEKDVRYLDSRIALLIQNKMGLEEQNEVASRLDESNADNNEEYFPDRKKTELYGNLFFLLQSEPKHIAILCRLVSMAEIDSLLQTVMFTIYGNQYEQREEHLLLTMFQAVLAHQFDTTKEFSSLLRANTPVSRMMTTYTRRGPGQSYLRSALSESLNSIIEQKDLNLEINPLKVYDELLDPTDDPFNRPSVTADEASKHPKVLELIRPRHVKINQLATDLLNTIIDSIQMVPYGIRWICKQIRQLTKRKYPEASDAAVCSLIGAFFFLRFVNPAIVTPQAYMLVDKLPSDNSRRVLTLIAKMLQNLANKPTYSKEPYMANLASFVDSNKAKINRFLNELCEVPDFYESLEMDQYVALSKKDLSLNITLNEIFGMHSLLEKYRAGVLKDNENSHLAELLDELGKSPGLVPRAMNGSMDLQLFNRWETDVGDVDIALDIFRADMIFMETKSLMINIIRAFPTGHPILSTPLDLKKIADFAASSSQDQGLVKRGIKAMDLLNEIEAADTDDADLLVDEVEYELKQLGSLKESVEKEAKSLEDVYSIIREHNEYLRSQLDTYRSYLTNVRKHTGSKKDRPLEMKEVKPKPERKKVSVKKYTPLQLVKEGVVTEWRIPENRNGHLTVLIASPIPGTFVICLNLKGRQEPIFALDLKLDDLLEMTDKDSEVLDLECVVFNIKNLLNLLKKEMSKHK